jgi:hypothetical protein
MSATRGVAELLEDLARLAIGEELLLAKSARQIADDLGIAAGIGGWIDGLADMDDATFRTARDALFLLLQAARRPNIPAPRT